MTEHGTNPTLRTYLMIVRKRRWWIAGAALLGLAMSVGLVLLSPDQYSATAQILVQSSGAGTAIGSVAGQVTPTVVQTDVQLVTSAPVQQMVSKRLGRTPSVSAAEVAQTNVIAITAIGRVPGVAAAIANAYARAFVGYQQKVDLDALLAAENQLRKQIRTLDRQMSALRKHRAAASQAMALLNEQAVEKQQLAQMQVAGATGTSSGVAFVTPAQPPVLPSSPKPMQDAALGLLGGLILGLAVAFLLDNFDDALTTKEAAEQLGGAPVLALVPMVSSWKRREQPLVVSISQPLSPAAEAYRSLRTSLQFVRQERELRTLLVTSPAAAEGKTSTIANLGAMFAQAGERVLLVSCDLRRPRLGQFFGHDEQTGITSVLRGERTLAAAVQPVTGYQTLWLLAAGRVPSNPAELLSGNDARELFASLAAEFDLVLIDSPPVLPVTDAAVLSKYADGALIVIAAGQTKRAELQRATEKLGQVSTSVVGMVLNEVTRQTGYGYGDGYGYGYGGYAPLEENRPIAATLALANGAGRIKSANGGRHGRLRSWSADARGIRRGDPR